MRLVCTFILSSFLSVSALAKFTPGNGKLALLSDGSIVGAGATEQMPAFRSRPYLYRLNPDGTPCTEFGENGIRFIIRDGFYSDFDPDFFVQGDDKIVVSFPYTHYDGTPYSFVARLTKTGKVDPSFGSEGTPGVTYFKENGTPKAIYPHGDGFLVLTTKISDYQEKIFRLLRYDAQGRLDTAFGNGGFISTLPASSTIQPLRSGKIMVFHWWAGNNFDTTVVTRLNNDGSPDESFATTEISGSGFASYNGVTEVASGRVVVAGSNFSLGTSGLYLIGKQGGLIRGFGDSGFLSLPEGMQAGFVRQVPSGELLVIVRHLSEDANRAEIGIARYRHNGSINEKWSKSDGWRFLSFSGHANYEWSFLNRAQVDGEGRLLVAVERPQMSGYGWLLSMKRLLIRKGSEDATFGGAGKADINLPQNP